MTSSAAAPLADVCVADKDLHPTMDSEAASPVPPLSPTQGTPTPSSSASSPGPSSSSSSSPKQECSLCGEDGPEIQGPPVPATNGEAVPEEEERGGPAEEEDPLPGAGGEQAALLDAVPAAVPEAHLSKEDDGDALEVLDGVPAGDADRRSSVSPVVRVAVVAMPEEVVGGDGLMGGCNGVVEEKVGDDDEKEVGAVEVRVSDRSSNLEVEQDNGFTGAEEEKEALEGGPANGVGAVGDSNHERSFSESSVGEHVSRDGVPREYPVGDVALPTVSSDHMETGDGATALLEDKLVEDTGKATHVDGLFAGNEEATTVHDASVNGHSGSAELPSSIGVTNGAVDDETSDGESKRGEVLSNEGGDGVMELLVGDAESEISAKESGIQCGAGAEEKKPFNSSETEERIGEVEKDEALNVIALSVDSGEAKKSVQRPVDMGSNGIVEESFPLESKDERSETKQASVDLQKNSKDGEPKLDVHEGEMSSERKVVLSSFLPEESKTEQPDSCMVLDVAHSENAPVTSIADSEQKNIGDGSDATDDEKYMVLNEGSEEDGVVTDGCTDVAVFEPSESAKHIIEELEKGSLSPSSEFGNSLDYSDEIDGQIVSDSDEEVPSDEEGSGEELFDSDALTAFLKAATGASSDNGITITAPDAARIFSVDRPAGLGSSVPSLKPAPPRTNRMNIFSPSDIAVAGEPENNMDEEEKKLQEKVEEIRVKFLRLVHRLGHSPEDRVAAQVLYRLSLAEGIRRGRQIGRAISLENAKKKALHLEEEGKEPLDFSCNILVLGKTGVGKSATINSIFGEEKVHTGAFDPATTSIKEITGTVDGVAVNVIDTPGLKPSVMDQIANKRILASIKKYTKRCPPDIVLYVDRLDTQTWDFNDLPVLRSIAGTLGSSIWFNAIVALTHAASAPPDGPSGSPLSYEVFLDQRSRVVQHAIRQAADDMRLMNPVALVENHPSCRRNREGERVLPNGLSWRTQMLLMCYSSKILSEANSVLKLQEPSPAKLFGFRVRSPPLPFLLSNLLQSRAHPKLAADQGGDYGDSDIDIGDLSDSEQEQEEDEYDQLPPFKPLRKAQIAKLTKEQRKAYFDEYDYRVKLLQKKQWKEELRRSRDLKNKGQAGQDESNYGDMADDYDHDGAPAAIPVPLPDMVLPPSFDCDNPAYRYRFLEPTSQLLVRPVLDSHGWDHDCGYDGVSLEGSHAFFSKFPAGLSVQITKEKKEFNVHLDSSVSAKHGETGSTLAGFDIQSVGKQLAYILRGETKFKNLKKNKTATGISVTFLGENIATGMKVEDQLLIGKRLGLVASTGAVRTRGDMAYGANLEMRLKDKDFPIGQDLSTLGLSLMKWHRDLALGANLQSQFSIGRNSKMAVRVGVNNKLRGQITVRTSTSEQLQIALLGILPLAIYVYRNIWSNESD